MVAKYNFKTEDEIRAFIAEVLTGARDSSIKLLAEKKSLRTEEDFVDFIFSVFYDNAIKMINDSIPDVEDFVFECLERDDTLKNLLSKSN